MGAHCSVGALTKVTSCIWIFLMLFNSFLWARAMDNDMYETGSSVYIKVFLPEIDVLTLEDLKPLLKENIQAVAMGTKHAPHIRDYDIQEPLDDDRDKGLLVSIMVDFSQEDGTPASLLSSKVTQEPTSIFPQEAVR